MKPMEALNMSDNLSRLLALADAIQARVPLTGALSAEASTCRYAAGELSEARSRIKRLEIDLAGALALAAEMEMQSNQAGAASSGAGVPRPRPRGSLPNSLGSLRAALRKYGHHLSPCMGYEGETCTCGFEAIFDACSAASGEVKS
jgi:hypothetical protein